MNVIDRFINYCKFETTSIDDAENVPSTATQEILADRLVCELKELKIQSIAKSENSYVYAKIPANAPNMKKLGLIAHLDTSNAASGKNVVPTIRNYKGGDIVLENCTIELAKNPELNEYIGQKIITSRGDTLLGCDDKGGIAIIMSAIERVLSDGKIKHGQISIAFTPDEEVARGTDFFELDKFDAEVAYTVDGGKLGEIEFENFNAATAEIKVNGKSFHPGDSKGKMVNAQLVLSELIESFPKNETPATTEGYQGFFYLEHMSGECASANASVNIRDHDRELFEKRKILIKQLCENLNVKYGKQTVECEITDSYFNMKEQITPHMYLIENAKSAMQKCDVTPIIQPIRGGTDGARLSYMGLPCPNLSTGGHNFHGNQEYVPVQSLEKMVDVVVELIKMQ